MVRERFDDAALGDPAALAALDHLLQLGFQGVQTTDAALDIQELRTGDPIHRIARLIRMVGNAQERADGVEGKPELAAVTDEGQAVGVLLTVAALIASRARRLGHEPDLLVVADRLHLTAGCARKVANPDFLAGDPIAPLNLQLM